MPSSPEESPSSRQGLRGGNDVMRVPSAVVVYSADPETSQQLVDILHEDVIVHGASSGKEAESIVRRESPQLVLADVHGRNASAFDILSHVRRHTDAPIMLLIDRNSEFAGECLELGADDCMPWPASERELRARVRLRIGTDTTARSSASAGDLVLDEVARSVLVDGRTVELTDREFELLSFLIASPGAVFTSPQLLTEVWGSSPDWQSLKTVAEHIYRLRKKIERDPKTPTRIVTVPRRGYRFDG